MHGCTAFNMVDLPSSSYTMPHLNSAGSDPKETVSNAAFSLEPSRHVLKDPISHRGNIPLLPKTPAASQMTSNIARKGLKRKRNPIIHSSRAKGIPEGFCYALELAGIGDEKLQDSAVTKRRKVTKACLRCQVENKKVICSARLPRTVN